MENENKKSSLFKNVLQRLGLNRDSVSKVKKAREILDMPNKGFASESGQLNIFSE